MKITLTLLSLFTVVQLSFGQNLFQVKLNRCDTQSFCLDCGDVKAGFDENLFQEMLDNLETKLKLDGAVGSIYFQVLVEPDGTACVLSHSDQTNTYITKALIKRMNKFKSWTPASREGKILEEKSSINVYVTVKNGNLTAVVERVDMEQFEKSLRKP